MRVSKKTEYALRALIYSARFPEGTTLPIRDLAEMNGIPKKFLELILLDLKNAGILSSRRGAGGGYILARRPEAIRAVEIVEVFEGPIVPVAPGNGSGMTLHEVPPQAVTQLVAEASMAAAGVFSCWTLADLVREENETIERQRQNTMYFI